MWKDKMIQAGFWSQLFYSISYPFLHVWLMRKVSEQMLSANQIIICIAIIIFNTIWNKYSDKLYKFFPALTITETLAYAIIHTMVIFGLINEIAYYIIDTILFSLITRNMICGGNKMRSIVYKGEKREKYDNTLMIATAIATLIGGSVALIVKIPIWVTFIISWLGLSIDNLFYILAYYENKDCVS